MVSDPLTPDEHRERILSALRPMAAFPQPLLETLGLAAADDVHAPIPLPRFANSAMDGYAVRWADVATAAEESPVHLPVVGEIGAGQAHLVALSPGTAARIMTGAPVPAGADSVVPYEWTDRGMARVVIHRAPVEGEYVRHPGEDIAEGDLVVAAGTVLGPRQLGLLAAVGVPQVPTRARPRVVILSTGTELRDPGQPVGHDSIYDSNSYLLAACVRRLGAVAYRVGVVPDSPREFLAALEDQLVRADLVITSGGISEGDYDVVKAALAPQGVWFGKVAMQPGGPQGFGLVGEDRIPLIAVPGNPVSAFVSFELFVAPALRRMMGIAPETRPTTTARLTHDITSPAGRRQYLRGRLEGGAVSPVGGPGSHLIAGLAEADALIVVPEDVTALEAGSSVAVLALED